MTMPNPSDKLSEGEAQGLGVAASSGGRSGGPSDPSPQAVSAVPAPAANATPGPWFIHDGTVNNDRWHVGRTIGGGPEGTRICDLPPYYKPERTAANARLIAAAPDLAEALQGAADMCAVYADFIRNHVTAEEIEVHPYLPALEDVIETARAALSRLTPSKE